MALDMGISCLEIGLDSLRASELIQSSKIINAFLGPIVDGCR